jgi:biopolymer transport protein ExbD/biopolymer transport protein TolR
MNKKHRLKVSPHLDMTPLIDVVFLLIIFFMLSSSFILQPGIKVTLPESSVVEPQTDKSVEITLTRDDLLFFNAEKISLEALQGRFRSLAESAPESVLVIKADGDVRHARVVEVMSAAKESGLSRLAVATRPEKDERR